MYKPFIIKLLFIVSITSAVLFSAVVSSQRQRSDPLYTKSAESLISQMKALGVEHLYCDNTSKGYKTLPTFELSMPSDDNVLLFFPDEEAELFISDSDDTRKKLHSLDCPEGLSSLSVSTSSVAYVEDPIRLSSLSGKVFHVEHFTKNKDYFENLSSVLPKIVAHEIEQDLFKQP
jgi:hypothetical protein